MFMMVISYGATVAALFILRWKRPDVARPYRCTGYPFLPAARINSIIDAVPPLESLASVLVAEKLAASSLPLMPFKRYNYSGTARSSR